QSSVVALCEAVRGKHQCRIWLACERYTYGVELRRITYVRRQHIDAKASARDLRRTEEKHGKGGRRIEHCRHAGRARGHLFEQLDPLSAETCFKVGEASGFPAGTGHTRDEAPFDRFANPGEYDRYRASGMLCCGQCRTAIGQDHIRRQAQDLHDSEVRLFAELIYSPTIINRDVAPHRPSQLCEALLENSGLLARDCIAILSKHHRADPPHPLALLRARRQRPRRGRAADERDERSAPHVLLSARGSQPTSWL